MNSTVTRRSNWLRAAIGLLIAIAIACAALLIYEWWQFSQTIPDRGWNFQVYRIIGLLAINLIFTAMLAIMAVLFLWARLAGNVSDLKGWHLQRPDSEFQAGDETANFSLDDYLAQERQVFDELDDLTTRNWSAPSRGTYSRYLPDSVCNPETIVDRNWNQSYVKQANNPIGGILLIHGLSDSPYSLRALGERLSSEGYTVVWLRVPGHGTCPNALAYSDWRDWTAAVRVAMRGLRKLLPTGIPLFLGGYSNGGALSVHYALSALESETLPQVSAIVLFSPMIGISPMARISRLYHIVGLVARNPKANWSNVAAEIDPFKYCSWPMNATVQAWRVTRAIERKIAALHKSGKLDRMPPVLTMQSVVDSTVVVPKLISVLYQRLSSSRNELFLFDINRVQWYHNLFNFSFDRKIDPLLDRQTSSYRISLLKNREPDSPQVMIQSQMGGKLSQQPLDLAWPEHVVSLSHIAVPFPPEDPIYGTAEATSITGLSLGTLSLWSEPSDLLIANSMFCRSRYNPFYHWMEDHVVTWLRESNK